MEINLNFSLIVAVIIALISLFGWGSRERSKRKQAEAKVILNRRHMERQAAARKRLAEQVKRTKEKIKDADDAVKSLTDRYSPDYSDK